VPFLVTRIVYGYLALLALLNVADVCHLSLSKRLHRVFGIWGLSNLILEFHWSSGRNRRRLAAATSRWCCPCLLHEDRLLAHDDDLVAHDLDARTRDVVPYLPELPNFGVSAQPVSAIASPSAGQ